MGWHAIKINESILMKISSNTCQAADFIGQPLL